MAQDSFSVFLETIKGSAAPSTTDSGSSVNPQTVQRIIKVLQAEPSGSDVSQLARRADVDFFEFASALQTLQKLGAVVVEGLGSTQRARLGNNWQDVISLLR
jgi:hypothetical protein